MNKMAGPDASDLRWYLHPDVWGSEKENGMTDEI